MWQNESTVTGSMGFTLFLLPREEDWLISHRFHRVYPICDISSPQMKKIYTPVTGSMGWDTPNTEYWFLSHMFHVVYATYDTLLKQMIDSVVTGSWVVSYLLHPLPLGKGTDSPITSSIRCTLMTLSKDRINSSVQIPNWVYPKYNTLYSPREEDQPCHQQARL